MKDLKEYDAGNGELDYKALVGDWIEEHPGKYLHKVTEGLMERGRGRLNPRGLQGRLWRGLRILLKKHGHKVLDKSPIRYRILVSRDILSIPPCLGGFLCAPGVSSQ